MRAKRERTLLRSISPIAVMLISILVSDMAAAQTEPVSGSWSCWTDRKGDRYCRTTSTVRMRQRGAMPRHLPPRPMFRQPPPVFNPTPIPPRTWASPPIQTVRTVDNCPRTSPQRRYRPGRPQISPGPKVIDVEATLRSRDGRPVCR